MRLPRHVPRSALPPGVGVRVEALGVVSEREFQKAVVSLDQEGGRK